MNLDDALPASARLCLSFGLYTLLHHMLLLQPQIHDPPHQQHPQQEVGHHPASQAQGSTPCHCVEEDLLVLLLEQYVVNLSFFI